MIRDFCCMEKDLLPSFRQSILQEMTFKENYAEESANNEWLLHLRHFYTPVLIDKGHTVFALSDHFLVPQSWSSVKAKIKYEGHIFQRLAMKEALII